MILVHMAKRKHRSDGEFNREIPFPPGHMLRGLDIPLTYYPVSHDACDELLLVLYPTVMADLCLMTFVELLIGSLRYYGASAITTRKFGVYDLVHTRMFLLCLFGFSKHGKKNAWPS